VIPTDETYSVCGGDFKIINMRIVWSEIEFDRQIRYRAQNGSCPRDDGRSRRVAYAFPKC